MSNAMLTTLDNPYNPHTEWDSWYAYDVQQGHNTMSLIDRLMVTSSELSDADQDLAYLDTITLIRDTDEFDLYVFIYPETVVKLLKENS